MYSIQLIISIINYEKKVQYNHVHISVPFSGITDPNTKYLAPSINQYMLYKKYLVFNSEWAGFVLSLYCLATHVSMSTHFSATLPTFIHLARFSRVKYHFNPPAE